MSSSPSSSSSSLDIVNNFCKLVDDDMNYQAASELLHKTDFKFSSPVESFIGREAWVKGFPSRHQNGPTFEEPKASSEGDCVFFGSLESETNTTTTKYPQVTRKGSKKMMFFTLHIMESYKIDEATGTIVTIHASLTKK